MALADRLHTARIMRGLSMQALAEAMGGLVTKQAISKYEKGVMEPKLSVVTRLASALGLPLDYFYRSQEIKIGEIKYRKLASMPKKQQDEIIGLSQDYLERYLEAETLSGGSIEWSNPLSDRTPISNGEEVEEAAGAVREVWQLGTKPVFNLAELLEEHGVRVLCYHKALDKFDGASTIVDDLYPFVVVDDMAIDRKRFTLAHELGHLVLPIRHLSDKEQERLCNRFAGAFLLPKVSLIEQIGRRRTNIYLQELKLIKSEYGISPQAILYRCKDLGVLNQEQVNNWWHKLKNSGMMHKEIGHYAGVEKTNRLEQIVLHSLAENLISSSKAAGLLNISVSELRNRLNIHADTTS